jgi:hypothetical protein
LEQITNSAHILDGIVRLKNEGKPTFPHVEGQDAHISKVV